MASLATQLMQCVFVAFLWIRFCCTAGAGVGVNADGDLGEMFGELRNEQREFDYFMLSLQWPGTACRETPKCCSSNACCLGLDAPTEFTIHGLWPDYNDGTWPACCSGKRFDLNEIKTLLNELNKYWPPLSCDSPSNCHGGTGLFWEHEWEKHGPCSFPVVHDEYDYFTKALDLYFKHNVTEVLRQAGYVASNSEKYPLGGIVSTIRNAFNATPELECSGDAVEELRLCFYKDFKPRDCGVVDTNTERGVTNSDSLCPKYVSLPELEKSGQWELHISL